MKTQISRWSDRPAARYQGVYLQQGRMVTDADWNEQVEHAKRALRTTAADAVGDGVPRVGCCLARVDGTDTEAELRWGAAHVDGIRAALVPDDGDLDRAFDPGAQADLLAAAGHDLRAGLGVYLDVWERTVVSLQDDGLVDPALAGADTASRQQVMAQIKQCPLGPDGVPVAADPARVPRIGNATIAAEAREAGDDPDPCDPCADELALDQVLPNALFRLEVHDVDDPVGPTRIVLKWSMENGAEVSTLDAAPPLGFEDPSHVYEVFNTRTEQNMGVFVEPPGGDTSAPALAADLAGLPDPPAGEEWTGVRRWDGSCELERMAGTWTATSGSDRGLDLVGGADTISVDGDTVVLPLRHLEVRLALGGGASAMHVLRGDHWLVRVRRQPTPGAGPDLRVQQVSAAPVGIRHHHLVLGTWDGAAVQMGTDAARRARSFPPLTDVHATDVAYEPCLDGPFDAGDTTVQKALDALCEVVEEDGEDCTPRLQLFGRGVVCGAVPTVARVSDPRAGTLEAIGDVLRAAPIERSVSGPRAARPDLLEERAELIGELVEGVEEDRIEDVRREVRAIRGAEAGERFDEAVRLIETFRAGAFRRGVTVRFATTAGTVVDGFGCMHDVDTLELRALIPSWRFVFGSPDVFPRVHGELTTLAEERPVVSGRELAASTWEHDVGGRVDELVRVVIAEEPEAREDVLRVLDEGFAWRSTTLRDLVAERFTERAERERVPVRASGHLYMVFPDGEQAALEFRADEPDPWVRPPKLLAGLMAGAFADASGARAKAIAAAARAVKATVAGAGGLGEDGPAVEELVVEATDPSGAVDTRRLASRIRALGGDLPPEGELAAMLDERIRGAREATRPVAVRRMGDLRTTVRPVAEERPLRRPDGVDTVSDPALVDAVFPDVVDPGVVDPGVVDPGVVDLVGPGVADPGVVDPGVVDPGVVDPRVVDPGVVAPGVDLPDIVGPGVVGPTPRPSPLERAWALFEDVECPQANDGSVCLGRVAAFGDRVEIVPDDREQLIATPAYVNAMYVRRLPRLFDSVMDQISGGDA